MDSRRYLRIEAELPIRIERAGRTIFGESRNISRGGIMLEVALQPPLCIGEELLLHLRLPGEASEHSHQAEVRWVGTVVPGSYGIAFKQPLVRDPAEALGDFKAA